jgi:hypothetical protein
MAGFLTRLSFKRLPIYLIDSDIRMLQERLRLTAAGTVQDSHLIPSLNFQPETYHHVIGGKNNKKVNEWTKYFRANALKIFVTIQPPYLYKYWFQIRLNYYLCIPVWYE